MMASPRADVLFVALVFACIFYVKKPSFITPDGISISFGDKDIYDIRNESFTYSSLWITRKEGNFTRYNRNSFFCLFLMVCGDIELNPGPYRQVTELKSLFSCKGVHFFHQNARGLASHFELIAEFLCENPITDIFALSETHTQLSENTAIYDIPGYSYIDSPRRTGPGGGV